MWRAYQVSRARGGLSPCLSGPHSHSVRFEHLYVVRVVHDAQDVAEGVDD
jgi:hypothetical protein